MKIEALTSEWITLDTPIKANQSVVIESECTETKVIISRIIDGSGKVLYQSKLDGEKNDTR